MDVNPPAPSQAGASPTTPPGGPAPSDDAVPDPAARRPGFHWMDVVFGLDLGLIAFLLIGNVVSVVTLLQGGSAPTGAVGPGDLWINAAAIAVAFGVVPVLWVGLTRQGGWSGLVPYFGLHRPGISMAWGGALALGWLVFMALVGLVLTQFGVEAENENLRDLVTRAIIPAAIAASFAAGFGEEFFFRGVLQKHIGVWGQAAIFGIFHVWQGPIAIGMTFAFAVLLGYMRKYGISMWVLIWGHTFFDLAVFGILLAA